MKEYARWFYQSKVWKKARKSYLISQEYICERCGCPATMVHHKIYITPDNIHTPEITLCFDNFEALCEECHNKEHHRTQEARRYEYDADGNITISRAHTCK